MPIETRLTRRLKIQHPIILAPMDPAAGGRLANAVTGAGGLGLIGGGYGDAERIEREFREAGNARVGGGFITWSMAKAPHLLDADARAQAGCRMPVVWRSATVRAVDQGFRRAADLPDPIAAGLLWRRWRPVLTSSWRRAPKRAVTASGARR